MNIVNPIYQVQDKDKNIFTIRKREYSLLEDRVREMIHPAEELGYTLTDFGIRESRGNVDLQRTLKQIFVVRLKRKVQDIDLSMFIPKLIDDNYIIINGRKKIPLFQLFDIPIITRVGTIKFRSNVSTIMVFKDKSEPFVKASFLNSKVPLHLLAFAFWGPEECVRRFNLLNPHVPKGEPTIYDLFISDMKDAYVGDPEFTHEDYHRELGGHYSNYNKLAKGEDIAYSLDLIPKVDLYVGKLLKTGSVLGDIIETLKVGSIDDTDLINKRVRCMDYMILSKFSKAIFDLCMTSRTSEKMKFSVQTTKILSECNVSDIVQFDFSINPIDELTKLSRTSLVGPGGFKRENVPDYLRDIYPSMFGRLCPVDTPDRDNCGVLTNLLPNTNLDENSGYRFTDVVEEKHPISAAVSMVPCLEHDDQTRLQMASSQMRQSIMLTNFDVPLLQSGCEGLYTDYTQFMGRAKKNGVVSFVDGKFLIVNYDDGDSDIFEIGPRFIYVENLDIMKVYFSVGEKVKKGDILFESKFLNDGKITIGKNMLTAVTSYYGYNYEDAIVISERVSNMFTSIHYKDLSFTIPPSKVLMTLDSDNYYKPLPEPGEWIETNQVYAKLKKVPSGKISDYCTIFEDPTELLSKERTYITDVTVYPNDWNSDLKEFNDWILKKYEDQKLESEKLLNTIMENVPKEKAEQFIRDRNLDRFSHIGKYKEKGERISGIYVEMFGVYGKTLKVGDKIGNRHGNKGVISIILKEEDMPKLPNGKHVDICINPLGMISRMNIGQLFELHLSMAVNNLRNILRDKLRNGTDQKDLKDYLLGFVKIVDNTKDSWYSNQMEEQLKLNDIDEEFITNFGLIQPPFESVSSIDIIEKALKYVNEEFDYTLYDPVSKQNIQNPIGVGYIYFFKMVHMAESRLAARGIGMYSRRTLQPLGGRKNRGGQRCGEMETACIIAHDGKVNLQEMYTTKSDCIDAKSHYIKQEIEPDLTKKLNEQIDFVPESVKLLDAYLLTIGVKK